MYVNNGYRALFSLSVYVPSEKEGRLEGIWVEHRGNTYLSPLSAFMFTPCPLPLFLSPCFRPSPHGECSGPAGVCSSNGIQGVSLATHLSHALQAPRTRHGRGSLLQVRSLSLSLPVGHVAYSIKKLRLTFRDIFCRLVFELAPTPPPPIHLDV